MNRPGRELAGSGQARYNTRFTIHKPLRLLLHPRKWLPKLSSAGPARLKFLIFP